NEVDIGMVIPNPELALFRHKMPINAYLETVIQAKRWGGPQSLEAGIAQQIESIENLLPAAIAKAEELSRLGANRKVYSKMKEAVYGENAAINSPHGPAHMLKNPAQFH
ncbi:MAG: enoyl-CoA hydratase/carnithine racemase, partial [Candidatus Azotimanducaceae bacterium]